MSFKLSKMKLTAALNIFALLLMLCALPASAEGARARENPARAQRHEGEDEDDDEELPERTMAAAADALVTMCVASGGVVVRGWERREVRVRADVGRVELRATQPTTPGTPVRAAAPGAVDVPVAPSAPNPVNLPAAPNAASVPAAQSAPNAPVMPNAPAAPVAPNAPNASKGVEVLLSDSEDEEPLAGDCEASGHVELDVPRGATIVLTVREGDIDVSDVAEARLTLMNGDADMRRIARAVEVENMSGSIFLNDSSGRVRLRTFSGDVEAVNVRTINGDDPFFAKTTSGNVTLDRVAHSYVEAGTVSGDVNMMGDLAGGGGKYDFQTFSGDVTLSLPADVSFKLNARVAMGGKISSDFLVKSTTGAPPLKELAQGRLQGTVGTGGPELNLSSFNGTLRLRKSSR
ncbi:MAG TPA: DUF4097 family beta strand repeat-containing protein [Pyrinomonadaceae bacterium]|nr:DUF4097 family beta strand repeat-containing protein [Pyrinomonadaceae bacterium]